MLARTSSTHARQRTLTTASPCVARYAWQPLKQKLAAGTGEVGAVAHTWQGKPAGGERGSQRARFLLWEGDLSLLQLNFVFKLVKLHTPPPAERDWT